MISQSTRARLGKAHNYDPRDVRNLARLLETGVNHVYGVLQEERQQAQRKARADKKIAIRLEYAFFDRKSASWIQMRRMQDFNLAQYHRLNLKALEKKDPKSQ
jgi:hypothetical protein